MESVDATTLTHLRAICLALPQITEDEEGVGNPSFKVRGKIFALRSHRDGRPSLWCKAPSGAQGVLVGSDPQRFFVPAYVGRYGWVGIWLDVEVDWDEIADLVEESYRMTAPKRLWTQFKQS